ncbi:PQQ-binding-like beta-propeller repeat protein [Paenibacillus sp. 11B]|uniref:outer membrane protein assembly factor BamB family protein n=1 Tax=unclassified Paenibacillus TaxID=185978 RepID=UPI0026570CFF|nr:PQQ-binding-like beta-propeller repeat protein [Paenibacillus sp. 11B]MDN8591693.1 PQQ-binding-like beta-propeller repeat protein [Paenibacillus sp. 11B]
MKRGSMWQKTGYLWITVAGISAVLVTAFMLVEMDTEPRAGQGSGSTTQALSAQAKTTYKKGDTLNLEAGMPLYTQVIDNKVPVDLMGIQYYTSSNAKIKIQAVRGEWIKFEDYSRGEFWIPGWYASKESRSLKTITPQTFSLRPGSKLYLAPGSSTSWAPSPSLTDQAVIVAAMKDWYGVSIAPRSWNKESFTYRPALLWIKAQSIEQQAIVADGWFQQDASQSALAVRHLTDIMLNKETTSKQVKQWLGEPDWKENSANLNDTGYAMSIGQTWRYERTDAQFLVTFNKNGRLARTRWNIPQDDPNKVESDWSFGRSDEYEFTTKITGKSLPITIPWKPIWTNQGDINYTFLQAATNDVLLMKGDDGGFSGGYYEGSIYALNRHSGQKLWQINSGYGALQAYIDTDREAVTIYTSYDPDKKEYMDRIRHLRLKDGEVTWEYTPQKQIRLKGITAAKNVVVVDSPVVEGSSNSWLTVLDSKNGKTLWKRKLTAGYELLNKSAEDPYVMYWEKDKLIAADPRSGRTVWSIAVAKSTIEPLDRNPYFDGIIRLDPFAAAQPERWMLLDDLWVLVDLSTGKKHAQFPARMGQQIEVLNDSMILIREHKNGEMYGDYADFTTTLYDAKSSKKRWTLNDKIERVLVEDDQLYVIQNGYPAALAYDTGETRWNAQNTISSLRYPTNQGSYLVIDDQLLLPMGEDLLIMDKHDGTLIGRVHDVVMGSPEHRDRDAKNGTMNRLGNEIYIGSSNGRFSMYEASDLNIDISR